MARQLETLKDGYQRFRQKYFHDNNNRTFEGLITGQNPSTLVIGCSDSRVDPAILMDTSPGDLFVVRNVANLVPPYEITKGNHGTSAALEFGVCDLQVKNIIVLGHSMCGGIFSLFEEKNHNKNRQFISTWMESASKVCDHHLVRSSKKIEDKVDQCSKLSIINSLENLMLFPWIKEKVEKNELMVHGWYFDIRNGKIEYFDQETNSFKEL